MFYFGFFFQGVMVRLMLVLAPVACILSGISVSTILTTYMKVNTVNAQNSMQHLNFSSFFFCFVLFCFFFNFESFCCVKYLKAFHIYSTSSHYQEFRCFPP